MKSFRSQLAIWIIPRELFESYQTYHSLFLGLPQLNNFKSVWSFWSLLLRLVRTRAAFSLGLIILCNWGKALLRTRYPGTWGFPVWLVGSGVILASCEHRTLLLLVLSMAGSWSRVPHEWPSAGDSRGPLMVSILSASSSPPTQSCQLRPLWSSHWTLYSISSTQVVTRINPSCSSA